eukprot:710523-Pelagomonas_calceolata.AAC.2
MGEGDSMGTRVIRGAEGCVSVLAWITGKVHGEERVLGRSLQCLTEQKGQQKGQQIEGRGKDVLKRT